jgi:IS30 family transposase
MKDGKTQSQIAQLLNRHKSTISRDLARNTGLKGYRPKPSLPASRGAP